jgi:hypothetical protein
MRANTRTSLRVCVVQIFDQDVSERLLLGIGARQAAHLDDGLNLLSDETTPAIGFRLGRKDGVHDRPLVVPQQPDETLVRLALGVGAKLATKDLDRDALLACERNDLSASHVNPSARRA